MVDHAELSRLCHATDEILQDIPRTVQDGIMGAINWHRLHCLRALEWTDDSGDHGLAVEIEEAALDATELQSYVRQALETRGWPHVEVRTEW